MFETYYESKPIVIFTKPKPALGFEIPTSRKPSELS